MRTDYIWYNVVVVNHAALHFEITAPCHSETPRDVFLHCFLEFSSCTIMGAGEVDAMLWCVCTAVTGDNDLGSTPSLRAHSEDFPKHRNSIICKL